LDTRRDGAGIADSGLAYKIFDVLAGARHLNFFVIFIPFRKKDDKKRYTNQNDISEVY
jgi:aminoglycoside/choline kinase family phosphotransferase